MNQHPNAVQRGSIPLAAELTGSVAIAVRRIVSGWYLFHFVNI
jgi:hypothetical protein